MARVHICRRHRFWPLSTQFDGAIAFAYLLFSLCFLPSSRFLNCFGRISCCTKSDATVSLSMTWLQVATKIIEFSTFRTRTLRARECRAGSSLRAFILYFVYNFVCRLAFWRTNVYCLDATNICNNKIVYDTQCARTLIV